MKRFKDYIKEDTTTASIATFSPVIGDKPPYRRKNIGVKIKYTDNIRTPYRWSLYNENGSITDDHNIIIRFKSKEELKDFANTNGYDIKE
ncbi:MAG: hypothetical protein PHC28_13705 [Flavobacterium sp.]|uniref:hypothetical protein n=1 Tax=Flavobacterium sp. TaxID=239 RepID=UPI00261AF621|nr:hypothetical protein [Flavobacterium sp.]MDD5151508.1 hypothetical protein [Flavobacterium sp.]